MSRLKFSSRLEGSLVVFGGSKYSDKFRTSSFVLTYREDSSYANNAFVAFGLRFSGLLCIGIASTETAFEGFTFVLITWVGGSRGGGHRAY